MVEETFYRAAHAAVIIGRAENKNVGLLDPFLQLGIGRRFVGGFRIEKIERLVPVIEHIHRAAAGAQALDQIVDHRARGRFAILAAHNGEDAERNVRHGSNLASSARLATVAVALQWATKLASRKKQK